jgi:acyl dehydratase
MTVYFEDLTVGDTQTLGSATMPKSDIVEFARQFDPQPFHVDEEAAADSAFGELVASGLHTLCVSVRIFVTEYVNPSDGLANLGGIGFDELRWHEAVTPGDELSLTLKVVEKTPSNSRSDRGYVTFERHLLNQDGVDVLSLRSINIVRRRDAVAAER